MWNTRAPAITSSSFYASLAHFVGATVVPLPLTLAGGFRYDPATLERLVTPRTRLIVLNSPSNPTGQVISRDDLAAIAAIARRHDIWVLSDEIYSCIVYDGRFHSIVSLPGFACSEEDIDEGLQRIPDVLARL